jgi:hypothetical protein
MRFTPSCVVVAVVATTLLLAVGVTTTSAFATVTTTKRGRTATQIKASEVTEIPYGEESRKYRRTVYSHDDWVKHRSPDRFWKTLKTTTKSGIYKVRRDWCRVVH